MITYLFKEIGRILFKKGYYMHSDFIRGIDLYKNTSQKLRKPFYRVIIEVNSLYRYWRAYPDTYFRFGMFLKTYNDFEQMKSFIPQIAYYNYSADIQSQYHVLIDDKILFHDLMIHYGIPVPKRYFTFRGGEF